MPACDCPRTCGLFSGSLGTRLSTSDRGGGCGKDVKNNLFGRRKDEFSVNDGQHVHVPSAEMTKRFASRSHG